MGLEEVALARTFIPSDVLPDLVPFRILGRKDEVVENIVFRVSDCHVANLLVPIAERLQSLSEILDPANHVSGTRKALTFVVAFLFPSRKVDDEVHPLDGCELGDRVDPKLI